MMQRLMALARHLRHHRLAVIFPAGDRACLLALCARRIAGGETRIVVCQHNVMSEHLRMNTERTAKRRARLAQALMCRAFRRSNGIVGVSVGVCEETARMCGIPRERITTIYYNPVVTSEVQALARVPLAHLWFQPSAPPVVLGAGRLWEQKDFQTMIRAFARVRRQRLAWLVILGEGGLRGELAALATALEVTEDVALPGFVRNPLPYMSHASVFALSSIWESMGLVLVEAPACDCPVVSTGCYIGPAEILRSGGEVGRHAGSHRRRCGKSMTEAMTEQEVLAEERYAQALLSSVSRPRQLVPQQHRVVMIGAGIVNLVTALALAKRQYNISIYDQGPAPDETGTTWRNFGATFGGRMAVFIPSTRRATTTSHIILQTLLFDSASLTAAGFRVPRTRCHRTDGHG